MKRLLGEAGFFAYLDALNQPYTRALRVNLLLRPDGTPPCPIDGLGAPVPWAKGAYFVEGDARPGLSPLHEGGLFYMQEPSALTAVTALDPQPGERVLDLCAAPGGKSTQIAALMAGQGLLFRNEPVPNRAQILSRNVERMGVRNAVVVSALPDALAPRFPAFFDRILVDAPCSGEGMFRKDTDSTGEWSIANVELCAGRGRRIIHDVWNALKPGGLLIYSTCTYNTEEDEENVHHITEELEAEALSIPVKDEWQITGPLKYDHPVYRFFPHKTRGEGFFLAALRKADGETEEIRFKNKNKKEKGKIVPAVPEAARAYLSDTTSFTPEWIGSTLGMLPEPVRDVYPLLREHLRILSAGICMGEAKGKDFIPAEELALSTALRREAFPTVDLDWEDAIRYLKKEALLLPDSTEKGYVLVCHKGFPLGFAKHLGNRANNLYPQEWRIRTGYVPEKVKTFEMKV